MPLTRKSDVTEDSEAFENDLNRAAPRVAGENSVKRREWVPGSLDPDSVILPCNELQYFASSVVMGSWVQNLDQWESDQGSRLAHEETQRRLRDGRARRASARPHPELRTESSVRYGNSIGSSW